MKEKNWINIEELSNITGVLKETLRRNCLSDKYIYKVNKNGKFKNYQILISSLPNKFQDKYYSKLPHHGGKDSNLEIYSNAPNWAKKQADKYINLIKQTSGMKYKEIQVFIKEWNEKYPNDKTSYASIRLAIKKYEKNGISGLISKNGQRKGISKVKDNYFQYFKSLYLKEGSPSAVICWRMTFGYARQFETLQANEFPSWWSFVRKLEKEVPEQAIYLARYGQQAWNKKYAKYVSRNYSDVIAGSFWVSDHAQIDVAVIVNGKVCFPWVTVFRDIKTSKWLGWHLHFESPNSDHIFQAFYYAAIIFGLPDNVYLDNGKDFRCKDFAGGRSIIKADFDSTKSTSMLSYLNINVHFALPYNAQTKPVERDFLKIKNLLSKNFKGYRGGNIIERPEKLKQEIKENQIMNFNEFKTVFDDFIINVLNKMPSKGKNLQGKCPDELWSEEFKIKKIINKNALKLFCMRVSKTFTIGRNGIFDNELNITYWAEWMIVQKGKKVYLRRDPKAYQDAWIFDASNDEFLGEAKLNLSAKFIAGADVDKSLLKEVYAEKKKEQKALKEYIKTQYNPTNTELVENLKRSLDKTNFDAEIKVSKIANTKMDEVINITRNKEKVTTKYVTELEPKRKIYLSESEKKRAQKAM